MAIIFLILALFTPIVLIGIYYGSGYNKYEEYMRVVKRSTDKQVTLDWGTIVSTYKVKPDRWSYNSDWLTSIYVLKYDGIGVFLSFGDWNKLEIAYSKYKEQKEQEKETKTLTEILTTMKDDVAEARKKAQEEIESARQIMYQAANNLNLESSDIYDSVVYFNHDNLYLLHIKDAVKFSDVMREACETLKYEGNNTFNYVLKEPMLFADKLIKVVRVNYQAKLAVLLIAEDEFHD